VDALGEYAAIATLDGDVTGTVSAPAPGTTTTPATPDGWHDITSNFSHGWGGQLSYMLAPFQDAVLVYAHLSTGTTDDGTTILTGLPPAYQPAKTDGWVAVVTDAERSGECAGLHITTTGQVQVIGIGSGAAWVRGTGFYRLSA
jgi:hypothetical protein